MKWLFVSDAGFSIVLAMIVLIGQIGMHGFGGNNIILTAGAYGITGFFMAVFCHHSVRLLNGKNEMAYLMRALVPHVLLALLSLGIFAFSPAISLRWLPTVILIASEFGIDISIVLENTWYFVSIFALVISTIWWGVQIFLTEMINMIAYTTAR